MSTRLSVIFVSTCSSSTANGPATYERYLIQSFSDHPHLDFYVVGPCPLNTYSKYIFVDCSAALSSHAYYNLITQKAIRLSFTLSKPVLFHLNSAYSHYEITKLHFPILAQINDDDPLLVLRFSFSYLVNCNLRRFIALLYRRFYEQKVLQSSSVVICNSHYLASLVSLYYRINKPKTTVIHKAVDVNLFKPYKFHSVALSKPSVVFTGANWLRKGLVDLLKAQSILSKSFHLHVVGVSYEQASDSSLLKSYICNDVTFWGRLSPFELISVLNQSSIFALPSHHEAFGVSILEAASVGLPVVASSVGGIPEIMSILPNSILVPPSQPIELGKGINQLLSTHPHCNKNLNREAVMRFSTQTLTRKLQAIYSTFYD